MQVLERTDNKTLTRKKGKGGGGDQKLFKEREKKKEESAVYVSHDKTQSANPRVSARPPSSLHTLPQELLPLHLFAAVCSSAGQINDYSSPARGRSPQPGRRAG